MVDVGLLISRVRSECGKQSQRKVIKTSGHLLLNLKISDMNVIKAFSLLSDSSCNLYFNFSNPYFLSLFQWGWRVVSLNVFKDFFLYSKVHYERHT